MVQDARPDWTLLEAYAAHGDQSAFETLVRRYAPLVAGVCRRVLRDSADADDAFQASFLLLARKAGVLREKKPLTSWLYTVAVHMAMKVRSGAAVRQRALEKRKAMNVESTPSDEVWQGVQPMLDEELGNLPEKYRAPLVLCYLEGKTNENAAEILGCPSGTMSRRLAKGRELLRDRLVRRGLVGVTAGVLASLLVQNTASAAVPAGLVASTLQAASGAASPQMLTLIQGGLKSMMWAKFKFTAAVAAVVMAAGAGAAAGLVALQEDPPPRPPVLVAKGIGDLTPETFKQMHAMIRPQQDESLFKEIGWFLSVRDARRRAALEGKPMFVWAGSGGPPIGIC